MIQAIQPIDFQWGVENPFLFCVHHHDLYPAGNESMEITVPLYGRNPGSDFSGKDGFSMYHGKRVPGFPAHPHRGFETVTVVQQGYIDHFDSKGAKGRYGNGDVQWLTTGSGCQHAEMFPLVNQESGNPTELFQIWLNLPAAKKFAEPAYKMLWNEEIPVLNTAGPGEPAATVRIIAGHWSSVKALPPCPESWAADPQNHVGIFLINLAPDAICTIPAGPETMNRNLYFFEGKDTILIQDETIPSGRRIKLSGHVPVTICNGKAESRLLLLEGEPIQEKVVQYGPFVMNTEREIFTAIEDFRRTEFGGWPWERQDPVNPLDSGRFAQYTDGTFENRGGAQ